MGVVGCVFGRLCVWLCGCLYDSLDVQLFGCWVVSLRVFALCVVDCFVWLCVCFVGRLVDWLFVCFRDCLIVCSYLGVCLGCVCVSERLWFVDWWLGWLVGC